MDGRELNGLLNYIGMEKKIRKIAINDKLASPEDIAMMSCVEVCSLIGKNYQLVYARNDEIGLVKNEDAAEVIKKIVLVGR